MYKSTNDFELLYQQMFNDIYNYGEWSSDKVRTKYIDGTPALRKQIIGYQFRFDNSSDVVPLLRSRFVPIQSAIKELEWIWIKRSNKVQDLRDLGCKYWNEWEKPDGTIGSTYGYALNKPTYNHKSQLHYILNELKTNKDTTRALTEMWNVSDLPYMSLTPCGHLTQWSVVDDKLILEVRFRSNDFALGMVSNVYQYSKLHKLVALECGYKTSDLIYSIHNLHYYDRHEENLFKQFSHYNENIKNTELDVLPTGKINNFTNIHDFKWNQVELFSQNSKLPKYKYEIAV